MRFSRQIFLFNAYCSRRKWHRKCVDPHLNSLMSSWTQKFNQFLGLASYHWGCKSNQFVPFQIHFVFCCLYSRYDLKMVAKAENLVKYMYKSWDENNERLFRQLILSILFDYHRDKLKIWNFERVLWLQIHFSNVPLSQAGYSAWICKIWIPHFFQNFCKSKHNS